MNEEMLQKFMTAQELADVLQCSTKFVRKRVPPSLRDGRNFVRYRLKDALACLSTQPPEEAVQGDSKAGHSKQLNAAPPARDSRDSAAPTQQHLSERGAQLTSRQGTSLLARARMLREKRES